MLSYCAYQGCTSKNIPCSSITFFTLPKDYRRQIWIENSGNVQLKAIGPKSVRYFCEKHFDPIYLKRQFTRTILHKTAVPYKYNEEESSKQVSSATNLNLEEDYNEQRLEPELNEPDLRENNVILHSIESIQVYQECSDPEPDEEKNYVDEEYSHVEYVSMDECSEKDPDYEEEQSRRHDLECDTNTEDDKDRDQVVILNETEGNRRPKRVYSAKPSETVPAKRKDMSQSRINYSVENDNFSSKATSSSDYVNEVNSNSHTTTNLDYEEDKHFALSLVGYFKRLPMKKKAMAKLKILQYLTELEYDEEANL